MKHTLLIISLLFISFSYALTTEIEDQQRAAAEVFMEKYTSKASYISADTAGQIAKLGRVRRIVGRIIESKKNLTYEKQLLLAEVSNVACEKSNTLG